MKKSILLISISLFLFNTGFAQANKQYYNRSLTEKERLQYKDNNIRAYVDYEYFFKKGTKDDTVRQYRITKIDTFGNILIIAVFDQNRKFETLIKYKNNEKNERTVIYYIEEGKLKYKTNNYYDLNNELIESDITTEFGSLHEKKSYYYKTGKTISRIKTIGPSGNIISEGKLKYNEKMLPKEFKSFKNGIVISEYQFKYDNDKLIESKHLSDPDVNLQTDEYFFYNKAGFPDSVFSKTQNIKLFYKCKYITFDQKKRNIEKWLVIPDFSKYFKDDNNYSQKFVYETPPQFPGGKQALIKYINDNLKYPKKASKAGIEGLVIVSFVIDATGSTGNIRVQKSVNYDLDNAAIALVNKMPKWKPALNSNGKETMSSFELPVNFVIK